MSLNPIFGGITMLILIAIILLCSAMSDWADASDWETSEREADRRTAQGTDGCYPKKDSFKE